MITTNSEKRQRASGIKWLWSAVFTGTLILQSALAADFTVTTPGNQFAYLINGVNNNPTITLIRGHTYTFLVGTSSDHPFAFGTFVDGPRPAGVSANNNTSSGTITFAVPTNAVDCVYYCTVHDFFGNVHMINPPPPPTVKIVGLSVGSNLLLTLRQASTNGFSFIPLANTNLATTNWFALTVQSNRFANGTNEVWCGKPPGTNVFLRVQIQ